VFVARYGAGPRIAGVYTGALDNTGEELALIAANDADIFRFVYNDKAPWPTAADGDGRSLVLRKVGTTLSNAANWRSSTTAGGNPGTSDSIAFSGTPLADLDQDGRVALLEYAQGSSDGVANDGAPPIAAIEMLDVGGGLQPFLTITSRVGAAADDAFLSAEYSTDLVNWTPAIYVRETLLANGTVTRKWRCPVAATGNGRQFLRIKATLP